MQQETASIPPWYKQPWLWFILTPILAAMTVGFIMLAVAIGQYRLDPPLDRDFARDGRGYVLDETKEENAERLGLSAELRLDEVTGEALLEMKGILPTELRMIELHIKVGANHMRDHVIPLHRIADLNSFNGSLKSALTTRSELILVPEVGDWHLTYVAHPPFENKIISFIP